MVDELGEESGTVADEELVDETDLGADCEEAVHRIYHFLDGELTEERRSAIATHLDNCGPCVDAFGFEAELRRVVANRCKDRVPDQLRQRIAEAIRHERVPNDGPEA